VGGLGSGCKCLKTSEGGKNGVRIAGSPQAGTLPPDPAGSASNSRESRDEIYRRQGPGPARLTNYLPRYTKATPLMGR
jgi:hypothetical protein